MDKSHGMKWDFDSKILLTQWASFSIDKEPSEVMKNKVDREDTPISKILAFAMRSSAFFIF